MDLALTLVVGITTTLVNVTIQAAAAVLTVSVVTRLARRTFTRSRYLRDGFIVQAVTCINLVAALLQMTVWALVFLWFEDFPTFHDAFHHSMRTYTTLGDDRILSTSQWKVLSPLEAANGMLMFGVAAAIMFMVMSRLRRRNPGADGD